MAAAAPRVTRHKPTNTLAIEQAAVPQVFTGETGDAFFCTDAKHPDVSGKPVDMFDMTRVFFVSPGFASCPTCPACKKQVAAIVLVDPAELPPSLQTLKARLDAASHV